MPRRIRIDLPAIPQQIVQRGNDRQPCFSQDIDRIRYLQDLREVALAEQCGIHAYVLMTNHVQLLVTPTAPGQVARMMQSLGRRYVRYVNARYHRSGTLWEGRYKASAVMHDDYVLRCQRYIELIPLRARMVANPLDEERLARTRSAGRARCRKGSTMHEACGSLICPLFCT